MSDFWLGFIVGGGAVVALVVLAIIWFNASPPRGILPW